MKNNESYYDIQKKFPEYVKSVKNYFVKMRIIFLFPTLLAVALVIYVSTCKNEFAWHLQILYSLVGSFFVSIGAIKSIKQVVLLNVARWGYNTELAYDMIKNSYCVFFGVFLIILSVSLEFILK